MVGANIFFPFFLILPRFLSPPPPPGPSPRNVTYDELADERTEWVEGGTKNGRWIDYWPVAAFTNAGRKRRNSRQEGGK
jgi:hypothetical protein